MLQRLKKSTFGKRLYRLSMRPTLGWPIRQVSQILQAEALQPSHFRAENRAHNRRQAQTLETFERGLTK